ncbi:response regulator [Agromyces sp. NPDC055661]
MARTVLLVDDHGGFRRMARLLLESAGYVVAGEAGSAAAAIDSARRLDPDLVLLDVLLPDGNGADVAVVLANLAHPPGVVLTSSYPGGGLGPRLQRIPVLGFVQKDELTAARLRELFG